MTESERIVFGVIGNSTTPEKGRLLVEESLLVPDDFSEPALGDLWRVLSDFLRRGLELDLFAVEAALKASRAVERAGGRGWLTAMLLQPPGHRRAFAEHARIVRDGALRRKAHEALTEAAARVLDPELTAAEVLATLAETAGAFNVVGARLGTAEGDVFRCAEVIDAAQSGRRPTIIPTGIEALDREIGGLQPDIITILGALPGIGKSAVLATIARNLSHQGIRCGLFSLEDERLWLCRRWMALESGVSVFHIAKQALNVCQRQRFDEAQSRVYDLLKNVVIDDRTWQTPREVAATARDMVRRLGCKALLIDHLGKLKVNRNRERFDLEVADALETILEVAKSEHVPVLMAAHLKLRPGLDATTTATSRDFANSPAEIERVARVIITACRPEKEILRLTIQKQNEGPTGQDIDLPMSLVSAMLAETQRTMSLVQESF